MIIIIIIFFLSGTFQDYIEFKFDFSSSIKKWSLSEVTKKPL